MLRNFILIAWRNLRNNRTFSIINIIGLSLSTAFCLLLFFYIRHEQSYDNFFPKKDRLFRLEMSDVWLSPGGKPKNGAFAFLTKEDDLKNTLLFPLVVGRDMQQTFPEVKSVTRFNDAKGQLIRVGKNVFKDEDLIHADTNFFDNFSFRTIKGDPRTALSTPSNVVLSASAARRYFGDTDPIGKTISILNDTAHLYTVAAIAEDAPSNSSIRFSIVMNLTTDPGYEGNIRRRFSQSSHLAIVELAANARPDLFQTKLNEWVQTYFVPNFSKSNKNFDFTQFRFFLRPLPACHYNVSTPWLHYTNAKNSYQLACLVVIILLIAALNYILLVISNAASRSQEVGVRKVLGAGRRAIVLQFWVETQILVIVSVMVGLGLSRVFLPLFNRAMDLQLSFADFAWKETLLALTILSIGLGLLAGYYPALIISKMKPVSIIKSFRTFTINPRFSNVMVTLQFTACIVLMLSAFIINRQMQFINNKDLGFDKDQVLMVENPLWDQNFAKIVHDRLEDFAKTQPAIIQFSAMDGGLDGDYGTHGFKFNGELRWKKELTVDYGYFEMLGLKLTQGRVFSRSFASDSSRKTRPIVVNETLFNMMGDSAKLGEFCKPLNGTIIGVLKDYHFETLSKKIEPLEQHLINRYMTYFMFKVRGGEMQPIIAKIEKEWKTITGNYPFDYRFLDQTITKMYKADRQWQWITQGACFFAIFIACMGLFGLSAVNAVNRTKETGIRKVLGATEKDIFVTLSKGFFTIVCVSIVIATPLAWWIMNNWLSDFAYHIEIQWWMFVAVGVIALTIALATVSFQVVKAALANPVDSLRTE